MSRFRPAVARWLAVDDGDSMRFCTSCAFSRACLDQGMDKSALRDLHMLVEHVGPIARGTHVFRAGDPFEAIAAVREGTVKTWRVDRAGHEQVLGFHLPGEIIGFSAIETERYPCNAVALDDVQLCRFSFPRIAVLASRVPRLQKELFRLMSHDIGHAERLAGDHPAEARLAAFLLDLAQRLSRRGFPPGRLELAMPRGDIANYLRLAPETVSRLFRRLQEAGLLRARGRAIELPDLAGLARIAAPALGN